MDISALLAQGQRVGDKLAASGETIAVAESSAGGLIAAALLARAGASAYFLGGAVLYTRRSRRLLTTLTSDDTAGMRSSSPPYARLLARHQRERFGATWGLAETGAAGPDGNTYGDPAGHSCLAVDGPMALERILRTGQPDRQPNMMAFAMAALQLLEQGWTHGAHEAWVTVRRPAPAAYTRRRSRWHESTEPSAQVEHKL